MNRMYLVRNLFSAQVAQSLSIQLKDEYSLFSIENPSSDYFSSIKKSFFIHNNFEIIPTVSPLFIFNITKPYKSLLTINHKKKEIEKLLILKKIDELFITYPIHPTSYLYLKIAKKLGIKICLYEEGICFHRADYSKESNLNTLKKIFKFFLLKLHGLKIGYINLNFDKYTVLDNKINLLFPNMNYDFDFDLLLLTRPMSCDYDKITEEEEINIILRSIKIIKKKYCINKIGIKFHPREAEKKRRKILNALNCNHIDVIIVENIYSAESIVYKMKKGFLLGYETNTLFFANKINPYIKSFTMLGLINKKIKDEKISVFINEIEKEYDYIKVLNDE